MTNTLQIRRPMRTPGIEIVPLEGMPFFHAPCANFSVGDKDVGYISMSMNGSAFYIFADGKKPYVVPLMQLYKDVWKIVCDQGEDKEG